MPSYLENFGLDIFLESEERFQGLMGYTAENGRAIFGYYGMPYLLMTYGDPQMILRVIDNPDTGAHEVVGMDTHAAGPCVWKARVSSININRKDADPLQKRVVLQKPDGSGGMAVVNVINADVLPSYMENDLITLQMVGFPIYLQYFQDEDEYADSMRDEKSGKSFLLSPGTLIPCGLLTNRNPNSKHFEEDENKDDWMQICGTVKRLSYGVFGLNGDRKNTYIRCFIDTEFGELELAHTFDQVEEPFRGNIRVGSLVHCLCVLSGDAAIYDYENGIVLDEKNNLALLRSVFSGDDPQRLGAVLCEDVIHMSDTSGKQYNGKQEVIDRIRTVNETIKDEPGDKCFAYLATITGVEDGAEPLPYGPDTRCLVLAYTEPDNYQSIVFIDLDKNRRIQRLSISRNSRYHFLLDPEPERKSIWEEFEPPKDVVTPILIRAKLNGLVDDALTEGTLLSEEIDDGEYLRNAQKMVNQLPEDSQRDVALQNVFGYLTAKAAEAELVSRMHTETTQSGLVCHYSPKNAMSGKYDSLLEGEWLEKLKELAETGKLFFMDYSFFREMQKLDEKAERSILLTALVLAQKIGKQCSQFRMNRFDKEEK